MFKVATCADADAWMRKLIAQADLRKLVAQADLRKFGLPSAQHRGR